MNRKILLVGEMNTTTDDPRHALSPFPPHRSGGRLAKILGLSAKEYLRRFERLNLCVGEWKLKEAQKIARFLRTVCVDLDAVVLLGSKVSKAFDVEFTPFVEHAPDSVLAGCRVVVLPHPSGRNVLWNDAKNHRRARQLLFGR